MSAAERGVGNIVPPLYNQVRNLDELHLLTLLEMSIPALKELSTSQYRRFKQNCAQIITADGQVDLFEWVMHRILTKELHAHFERPSPSHGRIGNIDRVSDEAGQLLSILASHGHEDPNEALAAFNAGIDLLGIKSKFRAERHFDYERTNEALAKLRKLKPLIKPALLKACVATVSHDGQVTANERALLQGIAATIDCPLPPLM